MDLSSDFWKMEYKHKGFFLAACLTLPSTVPVFNNVYRGVLASPETSPTQCGLPNEIASHYELQGEESSLWAIFTY